MTFCGFPKSEASAKIVANLVKKCWKKYSPIEQGRSEIMPEKKLLIIGFY